MNKLASDETIWSKDIPGDARNYNWPATFDVSGDGYLGITQRRDDGTTERVLLAPKQARALKKFLADAGQ